MAEHATTKNAVSESPSSEARESKADFVSEDVYAETRGAFTRVSCHDVYAFSSVATSGDFSETVDSLTSMIQIGVEIEFPNGRREIVVFQPRNLLRMEPKNRSDVLDALLNNGEVWVGEYDSVFTPAGFPKAWDTMIVPDVDGVDSVFAYRDKSLTTYAPDGKEQVLAFGGGLALVLLSVIGGVIGFGMINSIIGMLIPIAIGTALLYTVGDSLIDKASERFEIPTPHLWMQRMDISEEELDSCEPVSGETLGDLQKTMEGLKNEWTTSTVLNVNESPSSTTLDLLTSEGVELSVEYATPADGSDRFTLNTVKSELGVGSVQMLEGEQVELSLTSLGKEDDVSKGGFYRLRAKK